MPMNIFQSTSSAVDDVARAAASAAKSAAQNAETIAQSAQSEAQQALTGDAQDDVARAALASVGQIVENEWIDPDLAAGVALLPGRLAAIPPSDTNDVARVLDAVATDSTGARYGTLTASTVATPESGDTADIQLRLDSSDVNYGSILFQRHRSDRRWLLLVEPGQSPALPAGSKLHLAVPRLAVSGGDLVRLEITTSATATANQRGYFGFRLPSGTIDSVSWWDSSTEGSIGTIIAMPSDAAGEVTLTENGDGTFRLLISLPLLLPLPSGWTLGLQGEPDAAWTGDGSDSVVSFSQPLIYGGDAPPSFDVVAGGYEVGDPTVGSHAKSIPIAVAATAPRPISPKVGVLEIRGDNANGIGHFNARIDLNSDGALRLYVSEDNNVSARTMTLPASQWTSDSEREIALALVKRHRCVEALLAIDRVVATGLAIATPPTVSGYCVRLPASSSIVDGNGLEGLLDGGYRASVDPAEIDSAIQLPGINYVELGAS